MFAVPLCAGGSLTARAIEANAADIRPSIRQRAKARNGNADRHGKANADKDLLPGGIGDADDDTDHWLSSGPPELPGLTAASI